MKNEQCVTVVTITEETPIHAYEESVEVFSNSDKATAWIEGEIDRLVSEYDLDRENDVDGWYVRLSEDHSHVIQYSLEEVPIDRRCGGQPSALPKKEVGCDVIRPSKFVIAEASATHQKSAESQSDAYLLIDNFEGALSDFADETVVDFYPTEEDAISEVLDRVSALAHWHRGEFATDDVLDAFLQRDLRAELAMNGRVKYISNDGCRFTWQIMPAPIAQLEEMAELSYRPAAAVAKMTNERRKNQEA